MTGGLLEQLVARLDAVEKALNTPADSGALVSLERAARRLDVSVSYIRKAIREKRLEPYKVGACVRVRLADVDALAVRTEHGADDERRERVLKLARGVRP